MFVVSLLDFGSLGIVEGSQSQLLKDPKVSVVWDEQIGILGFTFFEHPNLFILSLFLSTTFNAISGIVHNSGS